MHRKSIHDQLRDAIEKSGKTRYRISMESGVSQSVLSRFVNWRADLTMTNAEKICNSLGMELSITIQKRM